MLESLGFSHEPSAPKHHSSKLKSGTQRVGEAWSQVQGLGFRVLGHAIMEMRRAIGDRKQEGLLRNLPGFNRLHLAIPTALR